MGRLAPVPARLRRGFGGVLLRLLLDTHTLIWALIAPGRLSDLVRQLLMTPGNTPLVSAVSVYEIGQKHRLGKWPEAATFVADVRGSMASIGALELPLAVEHARIAASSPWLHRDPFDRLLGAQALVERVPLVTRDPQFARFGVETIW